LENREQHNTSTPGGGDGSLSTPGGGDSGLTSTPGGGDGGLSSANCISDIMAVHDDDAPRSTPLRA